MSSIILEPGEIGQVAPFPHVVLPASADVFNDRARRFDQLAQGHAMVQFLAAMALLAGAQHAAFNVRSADPIAADQLRQSRLHGMPPLSFQFGQDSRSWHADLKTIANWLIAHHADAWLSAATALMAMDAQLYDALGQAVLSSTPIATEPVAYALLAPVVGAALQVWWTRQAASLNETDLGHVGTSTVCPVCAARPVASIVEIGAAQSNLRYLHCALCSTDWHKVRVTCTSCDSTKGIAYYSLNGNNAAQGVSHKTAFARAEACDACHSYLKIFTREKQPLMDVTADDLATLALDMLLDEAGYFRSGPNLLFSPGIAADDDASFIQPDC